MRHSLIHKGTNYCVGEADWEFRLWSVLALVFGVVALARLDLMGSWSFEALLSFQCLHAGTFNPNNAGPVHAATVPQSWKQSSIRFHHASHQ